MVAPGFNQWRENKSSEDGFTYKIWYIRYMLLIDEISKRISKFENLCASHNVKSLYAFGSSVTNRFDPDKSDIDLLVEIDVIDPIERGEKLISSWEKFEDFFRERWIYLLEPRLEIHTYVKV